MTKQTRQLIMMLIIGVLIGTITVKILTNRQATIAVNESSTSNGMKTTDIKDITSTGETLSQSKGHTLPPSIPLNARIGLTVADQSHNTLVQVSGLNVDVVTWVAIYDERDGKPGVILGAQKVKPGETTTTVDLLRREGTTPGMTYFAALLPDDGDGVFDRLTDLPPFSPEKFVIVGFRAL